MAKTARPVRGIDPQADAAADRMNERQASQPTKTFESLSKSEKDELLRQLAIRAKLVTE
jgi:hypothetical protein